MRHVSTRIALPVRCSVRRCLLSAMRSGAFALVVRVGSVGAIALAMAVGSAGAPAMASPGGAAGVRVAVGNHRERHGAAILQEFKRFLALPNVASDLPNIERNAELLIDMMESRGIEVFVACAGMANHLAGTVAAHTRLPVIGVPLASGALSGLDSLLSTVQMPPGVPVATVSVDGVRNAAFLAARILGIKYPAIRQRVEHAARAEQQRYAAALEEASTAPPAGARSRPKSRPATSRRRPQRKGRQR